MFEKVLIANRGEIARRIERSCRAMGLGTVAVFSDADRGAPHVLEADEAIRIGPAPARESYLRIDALLDAAARTGAGALHPGYGFLAENADLAKACEDAGIAFVGPTSETIRRMGSKVEARDLALSVGVPVVPGGPVERAAEIGFPILLKASAGGGGKGMRLVRDAADLAAAVEAGRREAASAFGDDTLLVERYVERPRHVEVQILGDGAGTVLHLFERECSIQRRHQKVVEETPTTALDPRLRSEMTAAAIRIGAALSYRSLGTVEFILDASGAFYFLEVNTRLQVEHPVTELVTGLDLVGIQLDLALGRPLRLRQEEVRPRGHAIECRLYAEDPDRGHLPQAGRLLDVDFPEVPGLRVDSGVEAGGEVPVHYDPLLAKVVVHGDDREDATRRMVRALSGTSVLGLATNRDLLLRVLRHPAWARGDLHTHFLEDHLSEPAPPPPDDALQSAAFAATLAALDGAETARPSLPALPLGWRLLPWRDPELTWGHADGDVEVRFRHHGGGSFTLSHGEVSLAAAVLRREPPRWTLDLGGRVRKFRIVRDGANTFVHDGERAFSLSAVPRFPDHASEETHLGPVAPMPGRVVKVLVAEGAAVTAGEPLAVLEAMKMEHVLRAPADGVVAEVLVEPGEQVDADRLLVRLADGAG